MNVGGLNQASRKSMKKTKKSERKKVRLIKDSDSQQLENDLEHLKEELDQAFK